jgi:prophage DNA circulation protein
VAFTDSIRPASFKGVPFGVIDASDSRGRVTVTHEFPLRDRVFVEDMGRSQRTIQLTAFVVGPGYDKRRDALIAVLEEPGPGTLVHPWLGTFQVSLASPATITHSAQDGGLVSFQLNFVEDAVDESEPKPSISWPVLAQLRELKAVVTACLALDLGFFIRPNFEAALEVGLSWAKGLVNGIGQIFDTIGDIVGTVIKFPMIASNVSSFVAQVVKAGSLSALVKSFWPQLDYRLLAPNQTLKLALGFLDRALTVPTLTIPLGLGTVRSKIAQNQKAVWDFDREMSGLSGLVALAYVQPESATEGEKLRELATNVLDHLLNEATSDSYFRDIQMVHAATQRSMADATGRAPKVIEVELNQTSPALDVAWRLVLASSASGGAQEVVEDLIKRNRLRHPGFITAGSLEVVRV